MTAETCFTSLSGVIQTIIASAPSRRHFRHRPPAWDLARIKNKAWRVYKSCPSSHNRNLYGSISESYKAQVISLRSQNLKNICNSSNRAAFYHHNTSRGNLKTYSVLRRADGELCTSDSERANTFLTAFNQAFRHDNPIDYSKFASCSPDSSYSDTFDPSYILKLISSLRTHTAMGPDNIPSLVIKCTATVIAPLLSSLFLCIFRDGWIPRIWRMATIIPVFKGKGSPSDVNNYRPIALTSIFAKLYEKCILRSLMPYLSLNKLIPSSQFGGLPGRSTTLQLIYCYNQWLEMHESSKPYDVFFLDITKAFDRVPRSKLASCLCHMGIPHVLVRAVMHLFDLRRHRVRVGTCLSAYSSTESGVVQGTVLGCILFILYTAPLSVIINPVVLHAFVDDMKWTIDIEQAANSQTMLNKIVSWLEVHGLEASAAKTRVFHCGRYNSKNTSILNGSTVVSSETHVDLGVVLSHDLRFNHHIETIVSKANRVLFGVLSRYKGCDNPSLVLAFVTFIRPILEYASPLWSPSLAYQIDHIERVQRSFTRKVMSSNYMTYKDRCTHLSIHSLEWRRIFLDLCLLFRILSEQPYAPPMISPVTFAPPTSTRSHQRQLNVPLSRTNARDYSFFPRTSRIWNSLPSDIVESTTINAFKLRLKDHDLSPFCHRFKF